MKNIKPGTKVVQAGGLTGIVYRTAKGTAETDGRFYNEKLIVWVRWADGTHGKWPADCLEIA